MSAQIITVAVIKGGTGKTTTCAALAQAAAHEGKRVLCVDLDPQGNLSYSIGADTSEPGAYEVLQGADITDAIQSTAQGIDVLTGAPNLADITLERGNISDLENALKPVLRAYDLIVIDTPPYFCALTYEALQACTGLLVAMEADLGSMQGLYHVLEVADAVKKSNKKLKPLGCIITRYNKRPNINRLWCEKIEQAGKANKCPLLLEIRQGIAVQEAQALQLSLYDYAPKSKPAEDYKELYNKIIK